jgi:chromosome segregation ATPase
MSELEKLDQRIIELHKKSDDMQTIVRAKESKLQELRDKLRDLEQEAELVHSAADKSAQARDMRHLENQLDKAEIKWHEAQTMRKTYEEIATRLQEERQSFDAQLAHFERTLRAKRADGAELELMSRDAHHAKELARTELARIEASITEDRKKREKDLIARRELVRQKLESSEKLERELLQTSAADAARGDGADSEKAIAAREAADSLAERLAEYEALIRHIKEATGADDLSQVVEKFKEQRETKERLSSLSKEHESKLTTLRRRRTDLLKELDDALLSGENTGAAAKHAMGELEKQLTEELSRYRETCDRHDRMLRMLSNVKSGVVHLWDKVKAR